MQALTYVEIDVDRCSNVFGTAPCAAVLGVGNDAAQYWDFDTNSLNDWTPGGGSTFTAGADGAIWQEVDSENNFILSPADLAINGSQYRYVIIDVERLEAPTTGSWGGIFAYTTADHGIDGSYTKEFDDFSSDARRLIVLDMSLLTSGGDDWTTHTITQILVLFGNLSSNGRYKIHSIRVCAEGPNYKCYNSLKTCADRVHLTPQTETLRFCMASEHYPIDIDAVPSIAGISFTPGTISLGEDLGQRATLTIQFKDHPRPTQDQGETVTSVIAIMKLIGKARSGASFVRGIHSFKVAPFGFIAVSLGSRSTRWTFAITSSTASTDLTSMAFSRSLRKTF